MNDASTPTPLPVLKPRRFKWLKRFVFLLFVLALLVFFAPAIVASSGLLPWAVAKASRDIDGTLTVGGASLGWLKPVELRDVTLKDHDGNVIASVPRIVTEKSLFGLIRDSADLGSVTIERPTLSIVCTATATNVETALAKLIQTPASDKPPPKLALTILDGTVQIRDAVANREWTLEPVQVSATLPGRSDAATVVNASLRMADKELKAEVTFGSTIAATVKANAFPMAVAGPLLRRFEPGLVLEGVLTSDIATTTLGDATTVKGTLALNDLVAVSPRLGAETLTLKTVELPCEIMVKDAILTISQADLKCDIGRASLTGTLNVQQETAALLQQPGLALSAELNLARIAALFPKLLHLQAGTSIREGLLSVNVRSAAAAQGATWTGNIRASALRGVRDNRPVAWEEPFTIAFDTRFDKDLLPNFEKLRVDSEFAIIHAAGSLDKFTASGDVSLDKLATMLREFIDLSGVTLAGGVGFRVDGQPKEGSTTATANLQFKKFNMTTPDLSFAANGTLSAMAKVDAKVIAATGVQGDLQDVRIRAAGLDLQESVVKLLPSDASYDRAGKTLTIPALQLATQSFSLGGQNLAVNLHDTAPSLAGTMAVNADLGRLQKLLGLQTDPKLEDAIAGTVRNAQVVFQSDGAKSTFDLTLPVSNFRFGPPQKPTWSEPQFELKAKGDFESRADTLQLSSASLKRPDGQGITARGSVHDLRTRQTLDLAGTLSYDLAKLEPQLKQTLGANFRASGKENRDFKLTGSLMDKNTLALNLLDGTGSIAWQSLVAYGFDVGAASLDAKLHAGILTTNAVTAKFGDSGTVKLQPTIRVLPGTYDLTFQKGRIIEKAKLTPQATADAIGFALPAIAKSTQAVGTISFDLEDHRLLLTDIERSTLKGKLTLHAVSVTAGPVITEVASLFGQKQPKLDLANEQVVPVRMEAGRVHHENLKLTFNGYNVTTSGSVGLDGTLALDVTLPLPENVVGPLLKSVPKLKEAIVNKTIVVPVRGTLEKPAVDNKAFAAAVKKFTDDALKQAGKAKVDDLLNKGLEKLIPKKP